MAEIRDEAPGDYAAIDDVHRRAFADDQRSAHDEQDIVRALRAERALTVSLVAVDGSVVGHVAVSPVTVADGSEGWHGLGPVSVLPERQGSGLGSALVREALRRLEALGAAGSVLVGEPAFYRRFGFACDPVLELPGVPAEFFLAVRLAGPGARGVVRYHPAFGVGG